VVVIDLVRIVVMNVVVTEVIVIIPVARLAKHPVVVLLLIVLLGEKFLLSVEMIVMGDEEGATVGPLHVVYPEEEAIGIEVVARR
jgi:hypothetical protein